MGVADCPTRVCFTTTMEVLMEANDKSLLCRRIDVGSEREKRTAQQTREGAPPFSLMPLVHTRSDCQAPLWRRYIAGTGPDGPLGSGTRGCVASSPLSQVFSSPLRTWDRQPAVLLAMCNGGSGLWALGGSWDDPCAQQLACAMATCAGLCARALMERAEAGLVSQAS